MELSDLAGMVKLCHRNINKLQTKLVAYEDEVVAVHQAVNQRWVKMDCVDGRLIALHDHLLSSLSNVNEYVIKLMLHINLNYPGRMIPASIGKEYVKHTNKDGIEVDLDMRPSIKDSFSQPESVCSLPSSRSKKMITRSMFVPMSSNPSDDLFSKTMPHEMVTASPTHSRVKQNLEITTSLPNYRETLPTDNVVTTSTSSPVRMTPPISTHSAPLEEKQVTIPQQKNLPATPPPKINEDTAGLEEKPQRKLLELPLKQRQHPLKCPKGGTEISSMKVYDNITKNIDAFPQGSTCEVIMMHLNIADNCFFVAKWGNNSKPLQHLLTAEIPLQELDQLPNFGEMFAIYDSQENIIPRVIINAYAEGGGYEGYLVDYGVDIHLNGKETIFDLPKEIKQLPAEAIKCYFINGDVAKMSEFTYQKVILRILDNNGIDLQVELIEENVEVNSEKMKESSTQQKRAVSPVVLTEEQRNILDEIQEGTSDAVKAVLGFKPKDDQRLCRFYDPKLNGCFKGHTCRLVHEPIAPFGATKDVELVAPLLESTFVTPIPMKSFELGSAVTLEVTFVSSPTQIYAQFITSSPPLIWTEKEVTEANRKFSKMPCVLDLVLAYYSDNCYYRAQIVDDFGGGEYKIFYVDYGNTEFVSIKSLAPCGTEESLKPHRAITWIIDNVVRKPLLSLEKTSECIEYLKSKILNMQIEVKITRQLPDAWGISLLGKYADIPMELIKRGYVLPNDGITRSDDGQFDYNEKDGFSDLENDLP